MRPNDAFAGQGDFMSKGKEAIRNANTRPTARVLRVSDVPRAEITWLWPGRVAIGKVTLLAGDPGLGKSMITVSMASSVTVGGQWPVDRTPCPRGEVILLSAEDDVADTIRPRLEAAGADVSRAHVLECVDDYDAGGQRSERSFSIRRDLPLIESELVRRPETRLVVIDPVSAYMDATDSHNNADVRGALTPLARAASRHKVAVVCVTHLNKSSAQSAMYRTNGSLAFVAAARTVFIVTKDDENPARRLFLPLKNNLGPDQTGLAYSVTQHENGQPYVSWESDPVEITATDALAGPDEHRSEREDAKSWLLTELGDGPRAVKELQCSAKDAGHSWRTVKRAKKDLGIQTDKESFAGGWRWVLPSKGATEPEGGQPENVDHLGVVGPLGAAVGSYEPGSDPGLEFED